MGSLDGSDMAATPSTTISASAIDVGKADSLCTLTVVIPLAIGETHWPNLLADLSKQLPAESNLILASPQNAPADLQDTLGSCRFRAEWLTTRSGRAAQMNDAAQAAGGAFLWFLHADTRVPNGSVSSLLTALKQRPNDLHYFGLRFHDGPRLMRLNACGVAVRSHVFGLPFGDQGFCISRELFLDLGGFDEQAAYGEDHLFVWKARRAGVRLHRVNGTLMTSGRKYAERGWLRTTALHLRLTAAQALPELVRFGNRRDRK
jgi:hypothetical protein